MTEPNYEQKQILAILNTLQLVISVMDKDQQQTLLSLAQQTLHPTPGESNDPSTEVYNEIFNESLQIIESGINKY